MRKVSVIIPLYNSEHRIADAINSVQKQSYPVHEILVYDDKSTDQSAEIVRTLSVSDSRLKAFFGPTNNGAGYARNFLLQKVTGDIIAFLDADDIWYPDKLSVQIAAMGETGAHIVTCGYDIFSEKGDYIGRRVPLYQITLRKLFVSNWIPTSMTIFERSINGAGSMSALRRRQDYLYWIKLFKLNPNLRCVGVSNVLGAYNRNHYSLSSSRLKNLQANYKLFRYELNFSVILSAAFVLLNVIVRLARK